MSIDAYGEFKLSLAGSLTTDEWQNRLPPLLSKEYRPGCGEIERWSCALSLFTWLERCCLLDKDNLENLKALLMKIGRRDLVITLLEPYEYTNKSPSFLMDDVCQAIEGVLLNGDAWSSFATKLKVPPMCLPHNTGGQTHPFWTNVKQNQHFGVYSFATVVSDDFMKAVSNLQFPNPNKVRAQIDRLRQSAGARDTWNWPSACSAERMPTLQPTQQDEGLVVPDEDVEMPRYFLLGLVGGKHMILHVKDGINNEKKGLRSLEAYAKLPEYSNAHIGLFESAEQVAAEQTKIELEDGVALAINSDSDEDPEINHSRELHLRDEKPVPVKGAIVSYGGKKVGANGEVHGMVIIAQKPEFSKNSERFQVLLPDHDPYKFESFHQASDTAKNLAGSSPKHQFGVYLCIKKRKLRAANVSIKSVATIVLASK